MKKQISLSQIFLFILPMFIVFLVSEFLWRFFSIYERYPITDIAAHAVGGYVTAWTVFLFYSFYKKNGAVSISPGWLLGLFLVGAAALVGILWEVYEFSHDVLYATVFQPSQKDTMVDLVFDVVGAGVFWLVQKKKF